MSRSAVIENTTASRFRCVYRTVEHIRASLIKGSSAESSSIKSQRKQTLVKMTVMSHAGHIHNALSGTTRLICCLLWLLLVIFSTTKSKWSMNLTESATQLYQKTTTKLSLQPTHPAICMALCFIRLVAGFMSWSISASGCWSQ